MEHVYFFYFFTTFPIGIVSLSITALIYLKTRDDLLRYYLYFYSAFTLVIILNTLLSYARINFAPSIPQVFFTIDYIEVFMANYILMFVTPVFTHYLFSVPHAKRRNIVWGSIARPPSYQCLRRRRWGAQKRPDSLQNRSGLSRRIRLQSRARALCALQGREGSAHCRRSSHQSRGGRGRDHGHDLLCRLGAAPR